MRPKKTKSLSMSKKRQPETETKAASMRAAAGMLNRPIGWVAKAKDAGVKAFSSNGTVLLKPVREWIEANLEMLMQSKDELPLRDQKLVEEVRKLRLHNNKQEGKLVDKAWVREHFHR